MATCKACGGEAKRGRLCYSCAHALRPKVPCSVCGGPTGWSVSNKRVGDAPKCRSCSLAGCGTHASYRRGCRCDLCRAAAAKRVREFAAAYREANGHSLRANRPMPMAKSRHRVLPRKLRLAIYERDGWVCQLCFEPVDQTLPAHHRMAATVDHIECQSWALIPDHSPRNLRLVHRSCNSRRYNRA